MRSADAGFICPLHASPILPTTVDHRRAARPTSAETPAIHTHTWCVCTMPQPRVTIGTSLRKRTHTNHGALPRFGGPLTRLLPCSRRRLCAAMCQPSKYMPRAPSPHPSRPRVIRPLSPHPQCGRCPPANPSVTPIRPAQYSLMLRSCAARSRARVLVGATSISAPAEGTDCVVLNEHAQSPHQAHTPPFSQHVARSALPRHVHITPCKKEKPM